MRAYIGGFQPGRGRRPVINHPTSTSRASAIASTVERSGSRHSFSILEIAPWVSPARSPSLTKDSPLAVRVSLIRSEIFIPINMSRATCHDQCASRSLETDQ